KHPLYWLGCGRSIGLPSIATEYPAWTEFLGIVGSRRQALYRHARRLCGANCIGGARSEASRGNIEVLLCAGAVLDAEESATYWGRVVADYHGPERAGKPDDVLGRGECILISGQETIAQLHIHCVVVEVYGVIVLDPEVARLRGAAQARRCGIRGLLRVG